MFCIGSLHSTQSLLIELKDKDIIGSDKLGDVIIYYGRHPLNTEIPQSLRSSNSRYAQVVELRTQSF